MTKQTPGSCHCGKISFKISGEMDDVVACHCSQCRKQSGHFVTATRVEEVNLKINDDENHLKWFQSSENARRGFCSNCGSNLFWKNEKKSTISIMVGGIDGPTGLSIREHIYEEDKGDYYQI